MRRFKFIPSSVLSDIHNPDDFDIMAAIMNDDRAERRMHPTSFATRTYLP